MIESVAVCGAGTMGRGIALLCTLHNLPTLLFDLNNQVLKEAQKKIGVELQTLTEKNKITTLQRTQVTGLLQYSSDIQNCMADVIIEAVVENLSIKQELFATLSSLNSVNTIFATNTSSLPITSIASQISFRDRVIGMHFFNPPTIMKLVEVILTDETSKNTTDTIVSLSRYLGKTPVLCKDAPGFIVNHVARPYYLEALRLLEEGIADAETIDDLMEATGFRMGPFRLMDLIGNDVNYAVSCSVYESLGNPPRLKPSVLQQKKVENRELGRKTGKGYYEYRKNETS